MTITSRDPELMGSFKQSSSFIIVFAESQELIMTGQNQSRMIGAAGRGRGYFRGRGHGGCDGCGGRGRGRYDLHNSNKSIPDNVWYNLTDAEKDAIKQARMKRRAERFASQVSTEDNSGIHSEDADDVSLKKDEKNKAGTRFGKKGKGKDGK